MHRWANVWTDEKISGSMCSLMHGMVCIICFQLTKPFPSAIHNAIWGSGRTDPHSFCLNFGTI